MSPIYNAIATPKNPTAPTRPAAIAPVGCAAFVESAIAPLVGVVGFEIPPDFALLAVNFPVVTAVPFVGITPPVPVGTAPVPDGTPVMSPAAACSDSTLLTLG